MRSPVPCLRYITSCLAVLVLAWGSPASAGISVGTDPDTGQVISIAITRVITDDPDPVPDLWEPHHTPTVALVPLNPEGVAHGDGRASALIHPFTGEALVAWAKQGAQGFDIVLSRFAGGSWADPVGIAAGPEDEVDPVLLVEPSTGTLHVIYWIASALPRVMHRTGSADGSSWSAPLAVSPSGDLGRRPHAVFHQGQLHVVYESVGEGFPATPRQINLATFDGAFFQTTMVTSTQFGGDSWPQVHTKRIRLWVDWIDAEGELGWSLQSAGSWEPVVIEPYEDTFDLEYGARGRIAVQVLE